MTNRVLASFAFAFLVSQIGQAKLLHNMEGYISVNTKPRSGIKGKVLNLIDGLNGWSCHAEASARLTEGILDHKGYAQRRTYNEFKDLGFYSNYFGVPAIKLKFNVNHEHINPTLSAEVSEICSRTVSDTCTDSDGDTYSCTTTEYSYMNWDCRTNKFPKIGESSKLKCEESNGLMNMLTGGFLRSYLKEKDIFIALVGKGAQLSIKDYNCKGNVKDERAKYLRFTQGVNGHFGENDFKYSISVNRGEPFIRKSKDGLLSFDMAYCWQSVDQDLNIEIAVVEEDPLKNEDKYKVVSEVSSIKFKNGEVYLADKGRKHQKTLTFERDSFLPGFIEKWVYGDSMSVKVELFKPDPSWWNYSQ